jgi:flagellar motor switch protein FliG
MEFDSFNKLTGTQKAAVIILSVDEKHASKVLEMMTEDEIKAISHAMSSLGSLKKEVIDRLLFEFTNEISSAVSFTGNLETTERLLEKVVGKDKLSVILEEIRGPAGKNTWDKLGNVNEDLLASYLKNEYPQTVALVVSKLSPAHSARILSLLPEQLALDVMLRLLSMESVKKEILDGVEKTLRAEFINTLSRTQKYDSNVVMAEIFNNFDRNHEGKFMAMLEERAPASAEKIKSLMFTFDDLINVDSAGIQAVLRIIDKAKLAIALKGASPVIRDLFFGNMSQRAAKIMGDDLAAMGPVRMRDVDEAQAEIITQVKELQARGEIEISDGDSKDELVY